MQVAKFKIDLKWKKYNVNLDLVQEFMKKNAGPEFCGLQAHGNLEVWFLKDPGAVVIGLIVGYWNDMTESHEHAKSYKSIEQVTEDKQKIKAAGLEKLKKLGLTEAEVAAILG